MRKKFKLTKESIVKFEQVLKDIKDHGKSGVCPVYLKNLKLLGLGLTDSKLLGLTNCRACHMAFPKRRDSIDISYYDCPCSKQYGKAYLIKRVKQIIETGKM